MNALRCSLVTKFPVVVVATFLTVAGFLLAPAAWDPRLRADIIKDCTKKASGLGNACGKLVECSAENCTSWFEPTEEELHQLVSGLPTDNWDYNKTKPMVPCGNGGDCHLKVNNTCIRLNGSPKYTYAIKNFGECIVAP
jgi:hypothetical protein